jgi:hypothetical protein
VLYHEIICVTKLGILLQREILYLNTAFMWLTGIRFSDTVLHVNVCKNISQNMIYIYFLYILCHIISSVADINLGTVQINVTYVHAYSLISLGLFWSWELGQQLQLINTQICISIDCHTFKDCKCYN